MGRGGARRRGAVRAEAVRGGGGRVGPVLVEMCILLSKGAFRPRDVQLEVPARVQNAHLDARGAGRAGPEAGVIAEAAVRAGVRDIELSKSVAKARIPSKCRKRIVDIPRFYSRPIPARGAFATDLDTPPPRTVPGAPPAPVGLLAHRFTRVRYALFPLLRPSTLHCTRRRGAAGSEGAQQTRRGAADDSGAPSRGPRGRRPGAPRHHRAKGLAREPARLSRLLPSSEKGPPALRPAPGKRTRTPL